MNLTQPFSLVHAHAELECLRREYTELNSPEAYLLKTRDLKQMVLMQERIRFLKEWIKKEEVGKQFPCVQCVVAEKVYKRIRDEGITEEVMHWIYELAFGKPTKVKALSKDAEQKRDLKWKKVTDKIKKGE